MEARMFDLIEKLRALGDHEVLEALVEYLLAELADRRPTPVTPVPDESAETEPTAWTPKVGDLVRSKETGRVGRVRDQWSLLQGPRCLIGGDDGLTWGPVFASDLEPAPVADTAWTPKVGDMVRFKFDTTSPHIYEVASVEPYPAGDRLLGLRWNGVDEDGLQPASKFVPADPAPADPAPAGQSPDRPTDAEMLVGVDRRPDQGGRRDRVP
jgi:hypothetical protein